MSAGLSTTRQTQHVVRNIRGRAHVAPGHHEQWEPAEAPITPLRRSVRPVRDGAHRVGAIVPLDSQHRASLGKAATALGWDSSTSLVLIVDRDRAVIRAGKLTDARFVPVQLDRAGRLQLPPVACGALRLLPGDQVVAVAMPDERELALHAASDVLQDLTGVLTVIPAEPEAAEPQVAGSRGSSIRRAFQPEP